MGLDLGDLARLDLLIKEQDHHDENDDDFFNILDKFSKQTIRRHPNPKASDSSTMSACYLSSSLPGMLDMVSKYLVPVQQSSSSSSSSSSSPVWQGLLANANVGGENVHRGSVMGAIFGARAKDSNLPSHLRKGLYHHDELSKEIDDFVQAVLYKKKNNSAGTASSSSSSHVQNKQEL